MSVCSMSVCLCYCLSINLILAVALVQTSDVYGIGTFYLAHHNFCVTSGMKLHNSLKVVGRDEVYIIRCIPSFYVS